MLSEATHFDLFKADLTALLDAADPMALPKPRACPPGTRCTDMLAKARSLQAPLTRMQKRTLHEIYEDARAQLAASIGHAPSGEIAQAELLLSLIGQRLFARDNPALFGKS
jgi:hypothetical protein